MDVYKMGCWRKEEHDGQDELLLKTNLGLCTLQSWKAPYMIGLSIELDKPMNENQSKVRGSISCQSKKVMQMKIM